MISTMAFFHLYREMPRQFCARAAMALFYLGSYPNIWTTHRVIQLSKYPQQIKSIDNKNKLKWCMRIGLLCWAMQNWDNRDSKQNGNQNVLIEYCDCDCVCGFLFKVRSILLALRSPNLFSLKSTFVCDKIIAVINWINKVASINSIVFVLVCLFWLVCSPLCGTQTHQIDQHFGAACNMDELGGECERFTKRDTTQLQLTHHIDRDNSRMANDNIHMFCYRIRWKKTIAYYNDKGMKRLLFYSTTLWNDRKNGTGQNRAGFCFIKDTTDIDIGLWNHLFGLFAATQFTPNTKLIRYWAEKRDQFFSSK